MGIKASAQYTIAEIHEECSVVISNDSHVFRANASNTAVAGSTSIQIYGYQGSTQIATTVGTISGLPSAGMTATINNNGKTNTSITIAVTTALTSSVANNGVLTIPITVAGKTINKTFSWSKAQTGATGATGATGKGVSSTAVTYQVGTSGTTAPTGTWSSSVPSVSAGQYLWTRTVITYTDNTTSTMYSVARTGTNGTNGANGTNGKDGVGVSGTTVTYQSSTSGTTIPTGTWSTTIPTVAAGSYLWTKTTFTYTDGTTKNSYSVGKMGNTGAAGAAGKGVKSTAITYQASTSGTTTPTGTWNTTIPSVSAGQYLWTRTIITYTDNTTSTSYSIGKMGETGATGAAGKGISSTAITYQASSSGTTVPTGTWATSVPSVSAGQYLWTRTIITYTDSTTSTSYSVGRNGTNGTTARTYWVTSSTNTVTRSMKGTLTPSTITFNSYYRNGTSATNTAYAGRFIIQESSNGTSWTTKYTSSANESSKVYTPTATTNLVRCTMYAAGGTTVSLDSITIGIIDSIDDLQVGGRNLWLNSSFNNGLNGYTQNPNSGTISLLSETFNGNGIIEITRTGFTSTTISRAYISSTKSPTINSFKEGETFTLSAYVYVDSTNPLDANNNNIMIRGSLGDAPSINISTDAITDEWILYKKTWTATADGTFSNCFVLLGLNGTIRVSQIKLEKANINSNWTPAPEDMVTNEQLISESQSLREIINQQNEDIRSDVETDMKNLKTEIENDYGEAISVSASATKKEIDATTGQKIRDLEKYTSDLKVDGSSFNYSIEKTKGTNLIKNSVMLQNKQNSSSQTKANFWLNKNLQEDFFTNVTCSDVDSIRAKTDSGSAIIFDYSTDATGLTYDYILSAPVDFKLNTDNIMLSYKIKGAITAGTFFAGLVFYKKDTTATGLGATAAFAQTTGIPTAHYLALNEYGTTEGYADFTQDYVLRTTPFVKSDKKNVTWTCEVSENNTIILPYEPYLVNGSCEVTIYNLDNTTFTVAATGTTVSLNKEREDGTIEEKEWPSAIAVSYDRLITNFAGTTATSITSADFANVLVNEVLMYYNTSDNKIWVYNPFTGAYIKSANLYNGTDYSEVDSVRVILGVRGASTSTKFKGHVEISDLKVEFDSLSPIWTQHPGETYSKQYTMDEKGFSISSETNMMFIDEDEIAAYTLDVEGKPDTTNPVFQISGEETILKKTVIKEDLLIENTTQNKDDAFIMKQYFVNNQWYFLFY